MTSTAMEQPRDDEPVPEPEFNLREWAVKARMVGRENRSSRRFLASNIRSFSFRESFRSNITISSTASSPGYALTEEIDPSTYSFTAALEALQARSVSLADGLALNSKWNEAEKYICNPVSGEVPTQCLSAKTLLSGRSFRNLAAAKRITMSAPLVYTTTSHSKNLLHHTKPSITSFENEVPFPIQENKVVVGSMTRDVGTQSTPTELSSSSPSPASTPPIHERLIIRGEEQLEDSSVSNTAKLKFEEKVEVTETREKEETKRKEEVEDDEDDDDQRKIKAKKMYRCCSSSRRRRQSGCYCLSWRNLLMRKRQRYIRETQTKKQPQQQ